MVCSPIVYVGVGTTPLAAFESDDYITLDDINLLQSEFDSSDGLAEG